MSRCTGITMGALLAASIRGRRDVLYAVVYWPDSGHVATIPRAALWRASVDGAELIADELDILSEPMTPIDVAGQSNPRRSLLGEDDV